MKQKQHMTPEEFREYLAVEVESIRTEIEHLRLAAEHVGHSASSHIAPDAAPVAGAPASAVHQALPDIHKV